MSLQFFRRIRSRQSGFSLLEMMVALMFIGILSAGMMRVYSSNLAGFQRVNDIIGSQRRGRWALASLQDDIASIGYFAFVGFNSPKGYSVGSGIQEPLMIMPGPTPLILTGPDPASPAGPLVTGPLAANPDEIQFVSDLPLSILAKVSGSTPTSLTVSVEAGSLKDLLPGDIVAVMDPDAPLGAQFEQFMVSATPSGNTISVDPSGQINETREDGPYAGYSLKSTLATHTVGAAVAFFRHNVVTRYSLQALPWDPSNPLITIPCLVRQQASYPVDGSLILWGAISPELIAENIEGFRVDLSFDGGTTWLRKGAGSWDAIVGEITKATVALGASGTPVRDSSNPLWFRSFPFLVRIDLTSRSAAPRSESSSILGQADYVRRTQTLMVSPRNFGLPL